MGLEGDFKTKGREEIGGTQDGSGRNLQSTRKGKDLARSEEPKMARVEGVVSYIPKGDDYRVTVEIWDGRDWGDKGMKVDETLSIIIMGMLRRWKLCITLGF